MTLLPDWRTLPKPPANAAPVRRLIPEHPAGAAGPVPWAGRAQLQAAILVLLKEQDGHGYELVARLVELGVAVPDTGAVYRMLRTMEEEHLVESRWETTAPGPARRVYAISPAGDAHLAGLACTLTDQCRALSTVLDRYRRLSWPPARPPRSVPAPAGDVG